MNALPLKLAGAYGSPYSLKMRAVLRYRQIPFTWVLRGGPFDDIGPLPVELIPIIDFPDADGNYGHPMIDSSPLIDRLETMTGERSLTPVDPVVEFIDRLIEDYGDEWVTKAMYHYRWYYDEAIDKAAKLLPLDRGLQITDDQWRAGRSYIAKRQIGRRALVGSTETNRPVIEESYVRLLGLLQAALQHGDFLLGTRPGRGDFGLFGQLTELVKWDPVSMRTAVEHGPFVINWIERLDDLSWWPDHGSSGWVDGASIAPTTLALLDEIGRTYVPFMLANEQALADGADEVVCTIDGNEYRQGPFKYQGKCLEWLREHYLALSAADRATVDGLLAGTGCERLFS